MGGGRRKLCVSVEGEIRTARGNRIRRKGTARAWRDGTEGELGKGCVEVMMGAVLFVLFEWEED
ncbi:hypothetical protein SLEP1_g56034 [Rubroshorea leprosula]|uniref:Uncharacterized protein n=1 Tax=Rubroshorea leprosula TaxID=152421 RepID=A0AAV5MJH0_9ROSI|nr:hypothetical protein SLEP1_g56034 [Rubroshorea leprosula]